MHHQTDAVLLSGVTGFVGAAVLARYLEQTEGPLVALVRAGSARDAEARVRAVLDELYEPDVAEAYARRCKGVAGDLARSVQGHPHNGFETVKRSAVARGCEDRGRRDQRPILR